VRAVRVPPPTPTAAGVMLIGQALDTALAVMYPNDNEVNESDVLVCGSNRSERI
jgi:hypothetical protein